VLLTAIQSYQSYEGGAAHRSCFTKMAKILIPWGMIVQCPRGRSYLRVCSGVYFHLSLSYYLVITPYLLPTFSSSFKIFKPIA